MRRPGTTRASTTRLLRPALLGARVLLLVAAVVLMHSLGVGHGPGTHDLHAAGAPHTSTTVPADGHHPASDVVAPTAPATPTAEAAGSLGHAMAAMCLAVLLLPLLLRRPRVRRLAHRLARLMPARLLRPVGVGTGRSPPPRPPLRLTLCVLRT
ncbi:hypothetical protein [Terracoccus luteus]|uniref:Uncharacterized protein n=1 Tax=Terracoccus luteus TaxID=53356 RepID=A0A495XXS5_9MICO|nr:hypothetical protein [Terracoccus luteus]MBB2986651.1 hypothetical protein [Terracoccus luteus]MCP2171760.1 hypothetical protein [Terracoccus luteus]RKT79400.1 hypothetical protein DFJ68_2868 [Terracoccus luteus]